jgi:DNA polymerase
MDRNEAVLRELNLYPQWVRRNRPAPVVAEQSAPEELLSVHTGLVGGHGASNAVDSRRASTGSARTETSNIHTDPSVATPASQIGNLGWPELKQQVRDCAACKLRAGCTQTVFGVGDEQAEWLFIGEGPGAEEDVRGEPFVGESGKLLDNMLLAIKLRRGKNVYIANVVKCRPPNDHAPKADEIAACLPYLRCQIELIKPKLIVALGKTAATALLEKDATIDSLRGRLHDFNGIPLVVTYHPAYLLRKPSEKAKAWQDLCSAVNTMAV